MFLNNTVFVLGAGASWHYGYPTGEGLVEGAISVAKRLARYCEARVQCGQVVQLVPEYVAQRGNEACGAAGRIDGWARVQSECNLLIERLATVRPLLIDYFLAWNETLQPIGKLVIAASILECEAIWLQQRANQNRRTILVNKPIRPTGDELVRFDITKYRDDWYRFVVHKLAINCVESADLLKNKVRFITFNYDASLEYHLYRALTSIDLFDASDAEKFLCDERIVHVYGCVHSRIPREGDAINLARMQNLGTPFGRPIDFQVEFGTRKALLDRCLEAAQNLRTIDPHDKEENKAELERARKWIDEAAVVYILGYGFDENNNRRIGLTTSLRLGPANNKSVMFTNYDNMNTINKRASKLFLGSYGGFVDQTALGTSDPRQGPLVEMSTRTVYEALERDFAALETELIAGSTI